MLDCECCKYGETYMKTGFSKRDITPPVGCELAGFGHFLGRCSTKVLEPLCATAMAVEDDGSAAVVISCDLLLLTAAQVAQIRAWVEDALGLGPDRVMVCCTHTHSGPATGGFYSLGVPHQPYVENLPWRIAQAGIEAYRRMREASIHHAEVPCVDIPYNRVMNARPDREVVEQQGWAAQLPGPVDETAHVVKFVAEDDMLGFFSYYSAHPVVCCDQNHIIQGDFVGLATNKVQRVHPGSVGAFLQGACGDINPGYCGNDQETSIRDLKVFSDRYAEVIESGLAQAEQVEDRGVATARKVARIPQTPPDRAELEREIRQIQEWLCSQEAEQNQAAKNGQVADLIGMRKVLELLDVTPEPIRDVDLMAIRFGGITLVSNPFELYNGIKNQVQAHMYGRRVLVVGYANDYIGYAPVAADYENKGSYGAYQVPRFIGEPAFGPYLEQRLVDEMTDLVREVGEA
jgi:hypothetical protein